MYVSHIHYIWKSNYHFYQRSEQEVLLGSTDNNCDVGGEFAKALLMV
jgi:hypothetical protein